MLERVFNYSIEAQGADDRPALRAGALLLRQVYREPEPSARSPLRLQDSKATSLIRELILNLFGKRIDTKHRLVALRSAKSSLSADEKRPFNAFGE